MLEDQNSEEQEVTTLDQVADAEPAQESEQSEELSKEERDWRGLRKKAEAAERRERELEDRLKQNEEFMRQMMQAQLKPQQQTPEVDEFAGIDPNDYPTWELADKRIEKRAAEIAERKYRELEAQREQSRFLERLKSKYPDFEEVVSPEAIKTFEQEEPELAQTIADLKDPYKMGLQTYNFLKRMEVSKTVDEKRHAKEVEKNLSKKTVQTPQAYDKRPMAKAFDVAALSKEEKDNLYNEMIGFARSAPGI